MMPSVKKSKGSQRGVALLLALIIVFILSALVAAMMFLGRTDILTMANYRAVTQARFTAEAGAQAAVNFLKYSLGNGSLTSTSVAANLDVTKYPVTDTSNHPIIVCSVSTGTQCATDSGGSTNGNYPIDSTQQAGFNTWIGNINNGSSGISLLPGSSVAVTAKLMNVQPKDPGTGNLDYEQTWEITSQASQTILNKPVHVQIVETAQGTYYPRFPYAAFATASACGALTFSSTIPGTDSYDSTATGGTCSTAPCAPAVAYAASVSAGGNIGSNGNLLLQGGSTINGSYSTPDSGVGTCSGGAPDALSGGTASQISGGITKLSGSVPFTDPPAPSPTPPTTSQSSGATATPCGTITPGCSVVVVGSVLQPRLTPGTYGNLTINSINSGAVSMQLNCPLASSPCTYNLNSIKVQGGGELEVVGGGQVIINVAGASTTQPITFSGGNSVVNNGPPSNLLIEYAGTSAVVLSGGGNAGGVVNTPNAPVTLSGGSSWFGAVLASKVTVSGGTSIHYDRHLANFQFSPGRWHVISFTWSKY